jgi:hypothetical protein
LQLGRAEVAIFVVATKNFTGDLVLVAIKGRDETTLIEDRMTFVKLKYLSVVAAIVFYVPTLYANSCTQENFKFQYQVTNEGPGTIRPATPTESKAVKDVLHRIIDAASRNGRSKLSWLDLPEFNRKLASVKLCMNTGSQAIIGSGTRTGSVYLTKEKLVVLNLAELRAGSNTPGDAILLVHEFSGALGYPDDNFTISALIYQKANATNESTHIGKLDSILSDYLNKNRLRTSDQQFATEGGSSGVGGGGDRQAAEIKSELLDLLNQAKGISDSAYRKIATAVLTVDIEPFGITGDGMQIKGFLAPGIILGSINDKEILTFDRTFWTVHGERAPGEDPEKIAFLHSMLDFSLQITLVSHGGK